jgi:hypothetical protein
MSQSHLLTSPPPPGSAMPCHAIPPAKHRHSTAQHRQAGMAPSQQSGHTHPLSRSTEVCLRLQKTAKKPHAQPRATGGAGIRDMQERGGGGDSLGRKDAPPVTDQANPGQSSPSDPSIHQQPTRPPAVCLFVCLSVVCAGGRHGHGVYGGRRKGRGGGASLPSAAEEQPNHEIPCRGKACFSLSSGTLSGPSWPGKMVVGRRGDDTDRQTRQIESVGPCTLKPHEPPRQSPAAAGSVLARPAWLLDTLLPAAAAAAAVAEKIDRQLTLPTSAVQAGPGPHAARCSVPGNRNLTGPVQAGRLSLSCPRTRSLFPKGNRRDGIGHQPQPPSPARGRVGVLASRPSRGVQGACG